MTLDRFSLILLPYQMEAPSVADNRDALLRQSMIGQALKSLYASVVEEPRPEAFAHLFTDVPGGSDLEGDK